MDSLRNVSEWEERLERIAHGGVNALVGHVFPLFQMVEGSGAPGAGNDPVQPRMDDQGVASRMDAVYPEGRAEGVRFHGSVAAGDVSRRRQPSSAAAGTGPCRRRSASAR